MSTRLVQRFGSARPPVKTWLPTSSSLYRAWTSNAPRPNFPLRRSNGRIGSTRRESFARLARQEVGRLDEVAADRARGPAGRSVSSGRSRCGRCPRPRAARGPCRSRSACSSPELAVARLADVVVERQEGDRDEVVARGRRERVARGVRRGPQDGRRERVVLRARVDRAADARGSSAASPRLVERPVVEERHHVLARC